MPFNYVIHKEQRVVVTTGSGRVTFAEIEKRIHEALTDPEFDPSFNEIVDFRAVTTVEMSGTEVRTVANTKVFSSNSKIALVVFSPAVFGMGRLFETYSEMSKVSPQVRIFYDLPSALKWLGLEKSPELIRP